MRRLIAALLSAGVLVSAALLFSAARADAATGDLIKTLSINKGEAPGELGFIYGLAIDAQRRIWVADTSNDRVQRFSPGGTFDLEITRNLDNPEGVAVSPDHKIYVTDSLHDKIKVFGRTGKFKFKWGTTQGDDDGQFDFPTSVAVAPNGEVWVADNKNNRVQKFTADGTHIATYDGLDLSLPNGVAVDPTGSYIYIADSGDDQIVKIEADGDFVDEWDTGDRPSMLAVTDSFVYVTNGGQETPPDGSQVEKFETDGDLVTRWAKPNGGAMRAPCGVAVTPGGAVYVAEFSKQRVRKYEG